MAPIEFLPPPPIVSKGRQYRELTAEEIKSVEPIFAATNNPLPDPNNSTFVGVVENGKVLAFQVLQIKLHAQPTWIEDGHPEIFIPLIHATERIILEKVGPQWVYLFASAGKHSQLAQSMGMQLEPWVVLSKLVAPELPQQGPVELVLESQEVAVSRPAQENLFDDQLPFQDIAMATLLGHERSETIQ